MVLAWHNYGGGKALLDEIYKSLNLDVVSYLYGPMPTQPLGWFKKPVAKAEDMKGLKFRTVGLAVDVFTDMGTAVNPLPGGEIVPALDRGLIDAAEFNNASSDRVLGFPDVAKNCMLQSFHQSGEQFEILFNKAKYDALPPELKAIIDYARAGRQRRHELEGDRAQLAGLHRAARRPASSSTRRPTRSCARSSPPGTRRSPRRPTENPLFKKVLDSQKAFAERAGQWQNDYTVDFKMAYNHYFGTPGQEDLSRAGQQRGAPRAVPLLLVRPASAAEDHRCNRFCWRSTASRPGSARPSPGASSLLTLLISWEVFSRYVLNQPHAWVLDAQIMLYGTLFMTGRRLHAEQERPCARRRALRLLPAAHAGHRSTWRSTSCSSCPASSR